MQKIDTKLAHEFTKDLSILYVEDDPIIQKQTHKFLNLLFKSVEIANDGQEALHKYQEKNFDIIITDIVMPNMNGLELSKKIKKINPDQHIIVTSAYNDSEQLIEFINLHVRQFMLKPVEINNMLSTLYNVSKSIVNNKKVEDYRIKIEKNNQELKIKNDELKNIVKILDMKLIQSSTDNTDINNNLKNFKTDHLSELKELESDISGTITLIDLSKEINNPNINILADLFSQYANILSIYDDETELTVQTKQLAEVLSKKSDSFVKKINDISIYLQSLVYVLKVWRDKLELNNIEVASKLHKPMIKDIEAIISIIDSKTN